MPRAPSFIRCPPFLKEFSRLGTHCAEIPAQWQAFTSGLPLPFPVNPGRDQTLKEFFLDLPAESRYSKWTRFVCGVPSVYQIPDRIASGLFFVYDCSYIEYIILRRGKADPTNWEPGTFTSNTPIYAVDYFPAGGVVAILP